jgi:hypothetical protein
MYPPMQLLYANLKKEAEEKNKEMYVILGSV